MVLNWCLRQGKSLPDSPAVHREARARGCWLARAMVGGRAAVILHPPVTAEARTSREPRYLVNRVSI